MKDLIAKIKQKKELSNVSDSIVSQILDDYMNKNKFNHDGISKMSEKELKIIIKDVRAKLRRCSGQYQASSMDFSKKLSLLRENKIEELLKTHSSTLERLEFYPELKNLIISLDIKSILDIGCGLNPLALASQGIEYHALDIKEDEIELVKEFFKKNEIKGSAFSYNIRDIESGSLPHADLCLLFKILDILDDHRLAQKTIKTVECRCFLISFSTRTLSGKPMNHIRRPWIERILAKNGFSFKIIKSKNEIFYLAEKAK